MLRPSLRRSTRGRAPLATASGRRGGNWDQGSSPTIDNDSGRADDVMFNGSTALSITLPVSGLAGRLNLSDAAGVTFTGNAGGNGLSLRGGIQMASGTGAVSIAGSTNLNGSSQTYLNNSSSLLTIGANVMNAGNQSNITFTVDGSGPITITSGITNTGTAPNIPTTNLVKNGTGTLTLSNGSMKGNVTVNSGVVLARGSNVFGTSAKTVTFNGGTIAPVNSDRTIPAAISWALGGDVGFGGYGNNLEIDGPLSLGGVVRTIDVGATGGKSGDVSFVGAVTNGGIIKTGPNVLTFNNALSTYSGGTTINGGTARFANGCDIASGGSAITSGPLGTGTITLNDGVDLSTNTVQDRSIQNNVVVSGAVTFGARGFGGQIIFNSTDGTDTLTTPSTFTLGTGAAINVGDVDIYNTVTGGHLTSGGTLRLYGSNTYSGGTTVDSGGILVGHPNALGGASAGPLSIAAGSGITFQTALGGAVQTGAITTAGTGFLNITDNKMVVRSTTDAAVRASIVSGFNAGTWDGPGINSYTARDDAEAHPGAATKAIGYANAGDFGFSPTDSWYGVNNLGNNDVLVRFTYYGDADLSGDVTLDDFNQWLTAFTTPGTPATWLNGDFDYSGDVTLDDFNLWLTVFQNNGGSLGQLEQAIASADLSSLDKATMLAAVEAVPEPTGLALLGVGMLVARLRRRGQR